MLKERFICCCRSGWGTILIAISQVIIFLYVAAVTSRQVNNVLSSSVSSPVFSSENSSIIIEPGIKLALSSVGLIFALLLLDGVLRHIPAFMQAWIVWSIIVLFFIVFKLNLLLLHDERKSILESMEYAFLLVFQLLGLFTVRMYIMDVSPGQFKDEYDSVRSDESLIT